MKIIKKRITPLLIFAIFLIFIFPLFSIFDYEAYKTIGKFGPILIMVFLAVGIFVILIDYLLFLFLKKKWILYVIEIVLIFLILYYFWPN